MIRPLILMSLLFVHALHAKEFSYSTSVEFPVGSSLSELSLNNNNVMAGTYGVPDPNLAQLRESAFLFSQGTLTLGLEYPGALSTRIRKINNSNVGVGSAKIFDQATNTYINHGLIMDGDGFRLLDYPGARDTSLELISNNGLIAGAYIDQFNAFRYFTYDLRTGKFKDLNVRFGGATSLDSINNNGIITGSTNDTSKAYRLPTSNNQLKFLSAPGRTLSALISPGGNPNIFAGRFLDPLVGPSGYLSRNGSVIKINPPRSIFTSVSGINNKNQLSLWGAIPGLGFQAYQYDAKTRELTKLDVNPQGESQAMAINVNGIVGGKMFAPNGEGLRVFLAYPR